MAPCSDLGFGCFGSFMEMYKNRKEAANGVMKQMANQPGGFNDLVDVVAKSNSCPVAVIEQAPGHELDYRGGQSAAKLGNTRPKVA